MQYWLLHKVLAIISSLIIINLFEIFNFCENDQIVICFFVLDTIYRWIEKKPLTEAVKWTSRENFWLMTAACNYGTNDW